MDWDVAPNCDWAYDLGKPKTFLYEKMNSGIEACTLETDLRASPRLF